MLIIVIVTTMFGVVVVVDAVAFGGSCWSCWMCAAVVEEWS